MMMINELNAILYAQLLLMRMKKKEKGFSPSPSREIARPWCDAMTTRLRCSLQPEARTIELVDVDYDSQTSQMMSSKGPIGTCERGDDSLFDRSIVAKIKEQSSSNNARKVAAIKKAMVPNPEYSSSGQGMMARPSSMTRSYILAAINHPFTLTLRP